MKLVVFGGRDFINYHETKEVCDSISGITTLIHGGALGADTCGKLWGENTAGVDVELFEADWGRFKGGAGHRRNEQMAEACDIGVGFWDGTSGGTKNMIACMKKYSKPFTIHSYTTLYLHNIVPYLADMIPNRKFCVLDEKKGRFFSEELPKHISMYKLDF